MVKKIAIFGIGAVYKMFYEPYLQICNGISEIYLYDINDVDSQIPDERFVIVKSRNELPDIIDCAIILTPASDRLEIIEYLVKNTKNFILEKPTVMNNEELKRLRALKDKYSLSIHTMYIRNHFSAFKILQNIMEKNYSSLKAIKYLDGGPYSWPVKTNSVWKKESGGIIFDTGPHVLGQLCELFPDVAVQAVYTSSHSNVEADVQVELEADGIPILVRMSRSFKLGCVLELKYVDFALKYFPLDNILIRIADKVDMLHSGPDLQSTFKSTFVLAPKDNLEFSSRLINLLEEISATQIKRDYPWEQQ